MLISSVPIGATVKTKRNKHMTWSVVSHIHERGKKPQVKLAAMHSRWGNPITTTVDEDEVVVQ